MPNCATLPASGTGTYHHHDALGNVVALTNAASYAVLETYTYDAFGKRTVYNATGQQIPDTAYANTHGYTGREHLPLSGLMDYRNRSYSTILGRFLQTDPIRFAAGDVNLYRYVANNPVNWSDSTGHAIDTFVDLGLILNDLYNIFTDPCNKYDHLVSLSLNSAGLFLPFATGLGATYKAAKAARVTRVKYIGRLDDLQGIPRNQTLLDDLPDLGSPRANYYQNSSVLRKALRDGFEIRDASAFRPNSELAPTLLRPDRTVGQTFLGAERLILDNKGLQLSPSGAYVPR